MFFYRLKSELNQSLELINGLRGEVEQKENIAKIAVDNKVGFYIRNFQCTYNEYKQKTI